MISLDWIRDCIHTNRYLVSKHGDQERQNDNLTMLDLEEALNGGKILEQYEDTGRGESCLVVGFTQSGKPIHCVCGKQGKHMVIVTVYIPEPPKSPPHLREDKKNESVSFLWAYHLY